MMGTLTDEKMAVVLNTSDYIGEISASSRFQ